MAASTLRASAQELAHRAFVAYLRHFPVEKGKQRLLSALWKPLAFGNYHRQGRLRLADVRVSCDVRGFVQRQLYYLGTYEHPSSRKWLELAADARVVFDVGANVGLYSLLTAAVNPACRVHAFEPTAAIHATLVENIRLNRFEARIVANQAGIGRISGPAFLNECRGTDGENDGMNYMSSEHREPVGESIAAFSLDDYCAERAIERIDLLKMDIEGGETEALLGARRLLERKAITAMCLETIGWSAERSGHSVAELVELLRDAGYVLYELHGAHLVGVPATTLPTSDNLYAFARPR